MSADLNEVDFGGAEGLPKLLAAAVLAPAYFAWSNGRLDKRAGRSGESGVALRRRAEAAAGALLGACDGGGQVCEGGSTFVYLPEPVGWLILWLLVSVVVVLVLL